MRNTPTESQIKKTVQRFLNDNPGPKAMRYDRNPSTEDHMTVLEHVIRRELLNCWDQTPCLADYPTILALIIQHFCVPGTVPGQPDEILGFDADCESPTYGMAIPINMLLNRLFDRDCITLRSGWACIGADTGRWIRARGVHVMAYTPAEEKGIMGLASQAYVPGKGLVPYYKIMQSGIAVTKKLPISADINSHDTKEQEIKKLLADALKKDPETTEKLYGIMAKGVPIPYMARTEQDYASDLISAVLTAVTAMNDKSPAP